MAQAGVCLFHPNDYLVALETGPYLPVQWRLVWFYQATSIRAGYVTVEQMHDRQRGFASFVTIAWDGSESQASRRPRASFVRQCIPSSVPCRQLGVIVA